MAFKHKIIKAQKEFDSGKIDGATWCWALNLTNGDEDKAKYKYIKLRALEMDYRSKYTKIEWAYWIVLIGLVWLAIVVLQHEAPIFIFLILFWGVVIRIAWAIRDWFRGGAGAAYKTYRRKLENEEKETKYMFYGVIGFVVGFLLACIFILVAFVAFAD